MILIRYDITLDANINSIPQIRDMLEQLMVSSRFNECEILEAQLALEEACTNIVMYAYPSGGGTIYISMEVTCDILKIDIIDHGVPFDTASHVAKLPVGKIEDRPVGGMGIYLIKNLMDNVSYERRGEMNALHLSKAKDDKG